MVDGFKKATPEQLMIVCKDPGVHFSSDIAGPFPHRTKLGHRYFLVIADNGSSYKQVYPVKAANGRTVAKLMGDHLSRWPETVSMRMDNGSHFKNRWVNDVLTDCSIQQVWSVPYAHHTNGVAERAVRAAKEWIIKNAPLDWDEPLKITQLNQFLQEPRLRDPKTDKNTDTDPPFSPGDRVWVTRRRVHPEAGNLKTKCEGQDEVLFQSGNVVHLAKFGQTHPRQIRRII